MTECSRRPILTVTSLRDHQPLLPTNTNAVKHGCGLGQGGMCVCVFFFDSLTCPQCQFSKCPHTPTDKRKDAQAHRAHTYSDAQSLLRYLPPSHFPFAWWQPRRSRTCRKPINKPGPVAACQHWRTGSKVKQASCQETGPSLGFFHLSLIWRCNPGFSAAIDALWKGLFWQFHVLSLWVCVGGACSDLFLLVCEWKRLSLCLLMLLDHRQVKW